MMQQRIYLNTASCGLVQEGSLKNAYAFYRGMGEEASAVAEQVRQEGLQRIRRTVASFLDAPEEQVALVPNFSYAHNAFVQSLRGDERVLLYNNDYPSLVEPFVLNGFPITRIRSEDGFRIDPERVKETLIRDRIEILALSQVQWLTGFKTDIEDLGGFCREQGILFLVDATQSLGALSFSCRKIPVDVMIASNYKWMNAGFGTGVMYMTEACLERYPPVIGGSNAYQVAQRLPDTRPSLRNYEPGHLNLPGLLILEAAIEQKQALGLRQIEAHNRALLERLLASLPADLRSADAGRDSLGSFLALRDRSGLYSRLTEGGVVCLKRGEHVRLGFHFYNTEAEADRLLELIHR